MRKRLFLSAGAASVLGVPLLGGCARGDANTVRFWAMGREGEVAAELVAGFERQNPGVRVRVEQLPWSAAHEKLLTAFAGDATPDVAQVGNTWLPEMAALGALAPLARLLDATPAIDAADHYAGIWQTNAVDGVRVGLPWYVDTRLLYYRRDLLAAAGFPSPPASHDGWLRCMAALQRGSAGGTPPLPGIVHPLLMPTTEFEPLLALALQQPGSLLKDGGRRGNFSGAGFRAALALYLQLFARGFAPDVGSNQVANLWQEFGRGTFAFYVSGPWNIGEFKRRLPAELQASWATAPLPGPGPAAATVAAGDGRAGGADRTRAPSPQPSPASGRGGADDAAAAGFGASIAGGASLVIFRRSRVQPLAWKLVEYLSQPAVQLQFYRLTGNLPPRRSSWALPLDTAGGTLAADPHARAFAAQLERVRPPPAVPEWERIAQEMQLAAARAVHAGDSARDGAADVDARIDTAVRALDGRVDAILEKRRWMLDRAAGRSTAATAPAAMASTSATLAPSASTAAAAAAAAPTVASTPVSTAAAAATGAPA